MTTTIRLLENTSSRAGDASVLVTAQFARALPAACCGAYATTERSPWVPPVRALQTTSGAGLTRLEWRCAHASVTEQWHTQWFDAHDVPFVQKAANANALLGRGPHEQPFEVENANRIELWTSPTLGRFTLAKQHIAAGQCALKATAFAVVVKQQLVRKRCHWCFGALTKKAFQCGDCRFALYCSRDCLDADEVLHGFQCRTLEQLGDNSSSSNRAELARLKASWETVGIDVETLRLTLAVLSMENFVRTTTPLARLVTNSSSARKNSQIFSQVASFLVAGITSNSATSHSDSFVSQVATPSHVQQTLERVQSNAHPLCLDGTVTVGVGVFPEAAMALNHSCLPNVVPSFDIKTRTLAFHAIRDIAQGHAVEYAYIDLFQATASRQEALVDGFGFACTCWRCVNEPQTRPLSPKEEEEESVVVKQLMQLRSSDQLYDRRHHHQSQQQQQQQSLLAEELFRRHRSVFARSPELLFAYHMLQMKHAASERRWFVVISAAETLMSMWSALALPEVYPTLEVLHLQVQIAAEQAGDTARAALARARVSEVRRICGYKHLMEA